MERIYKLLIGEGIFIVLFYLLIFLLRRYRKGGLLGIPKNLQWLKEN